MGADVNHSIRTCDRRLYLLDIYRPLCPILLEPVYLWSYVMDHEVHFRRIFDYRPKRSIFIKLLALAVIVLFLLYYLKGVAA